MDVPRNRGGSARTYLRDPSGLALSVNAGSTLSNLGRDRLGSITGLTSTAQALTGSLTYDPWGRPGATSGNAADNNPRFAASRRDPGTSYHQMGVRTYQYAWARFTIPASITHLNRYTYAGANPANFGSDGTTFENLQQFIGGCDLPTFGAVLLASSIALGIILRRQVDRRARSRTSTGIDPLSWTLHD